MVYGYIQIFTVEFANLSPNGLINKKKWKILFTPNEECIKTKFNYDGFPLISKIKNIDIIDTFRIEFDKIFAIFSHSKNKNLIAEIKDGTLTVIGDCSKLLLLQKLPVSYNIEPIEVTLKASNDFLIKNGLPPLRWQISN
jgi:hypothetical protein